MKSGIQAGLLALVASLAFGQTITPRWFQTLSTGQNFIEGGTYALGSYWVVTFTDPGQLLQINPTTGATTNSVTFPNDGNHKHPSTVIYVPSKGKLYVLFGGFLTQTNVTIGEVDPTTLTSTDVVSDTVPPANVASIGTMVSDGTYLYVVKNQNSPLNSSALIRYRLSDYARVSNITYGNRSNPHAMVYDAAHGKLYSSTSTIPTEISRIDTATFTAEDSQDLTVAFVSPQEMAFDGTYIYIQSESTSPNTTGANVIRIDRTNLTSQTLIDFTPTLGAGWSSDGGCIFDGTYVWATFVNTSTQRSALGRITPGTLATSVFYFGTSELSLNEITTDGTNLYYASLTNPAWVGSANPGAAPTNPCTTDANGICITGLSAIQNNLLGPLTPYGSNPWTFGDLAEKGTADNMAPIALAAAPALGTPLAGTFSWVQGNQFFTTTVDQRVPLAGVAWITIAWTTVDGPGTGRFMCPISNVTSTTVVCADGDFQQPSQSGMTGYLMPPPNSYGCDFQCWTTENPSTVWNYYDVAIALYRLWIRTGNATYLTQARAYADIQWQWTLDHGYRRQLAPRAAAMISQFFRVTEGHTERLPGLYTWISSEIPRWADPSASPAIDNREAGYVLWDIALGAKVDTDPTRHAQYCSWLSTYTSIWNSVQAPDGSWPEAEYEINPTFVAAPKAFASPFLYPGAPWREAINVKAMEASYESLNDNGAQGCNNPSLAAATLAVITKAVTWQNNYGRDTSNRGIYYEVNSQSNDQLTISPGAGTVAITHGSTSIVGSGTNFLAQCTSNPFIGLNTPRTIYKFSSCADNTHATLTVPYGLYGEIGNLSGSAVAYAPSASAACHSSATYCNNGTGDRNLTRTVCGGIAWLYAQTFNATYLAWTNECLAAQLGGPTAGLTSAANEGLKTLPCSGPACDGLVTDTWEAAANCNTTSPVNTPPCLFGNLGADNITILGKNYGEAFGAPGIDNALGWRLASSAPVITTTNPLPSGTIGTPYSFAFAATGSGTITWSATGLPSWATLSSAGLLNGTPNAVATTTMSVRATNSAGSAGPTNFSLTIAGIPPVITSMSPLPGGTNGTPYSFQFAATGTSPVTWSATGLPAWASLSASGLLTGTPNVSTTTILAVTASNVAGTDGPHNFSLTVVTPPVAPTITSTSPLPNGTLGTGYSFQFAAGGSAPITWSGTGLPGWASLSSAGMLTGTPNAVAVSTLHVTATNGTGSDGPHDFSLTVTGVAPSITSTTPLPGATAGTAYSYQFTATGTAPITWGATGLPSWASLSSVGALTGTPPTAASSSFAVTATNSTGSDGPRTFTLTIANPNLAPIITSVSPLPNGAVGTPYSYTFRATGTTPINWTSTGLPSWATLGITGILTGTPSVSGTTSFNVTATNTFGVAGPSPFSITIAGVTPPLPTCAPATHAVPPVLPNVLDIQLQTNMALGIVGCTNSITQSGSCSATDVQRVVNASLGQGCVIGP